MSAPRYPLLHQQPFFTEGHYRAVARIADRGTQDPATPSLPQTERANGELIRLPSFPNAERALVDQYAHAFEKVLAHQTTIAARLEAGRTAG